MRYTAMRYQVRFDDRVNLWIVIDSRVGGKVTGRYETLQEARDSAWGEEERWYKCCGEGSSDMLLSVA